MRSATIEEERTRKSKSAGFTIVGLSMLMVILGLFISIVPYLSPGNREVSDKETSILLEANLNAIVGFSGVQGRVPSATDYPSLVRSQMDGYRNATHYTYDSFLATPGGICRAKRGQVGLRIVGAPGQVAAFVVWSDGMDGKTGPAKPEGAVPAHTSVEADSGDDIVKWVSVAELKTAAQCQ